jgi:hypothetical protein
VAPACRFRRMGRASRNLKVTRYAVTFMLEQRGLSPADILLGVDV